MAWVFHEMKEKGSHLPLRQSYLLSQTPPPPPPQLANLQSGGFGLNNKVSPSILLIIIILAIIFFVSGLLHLLVRFLLRPPGRDPDDLDNVTALQGQLQQLFHLHDGGVDQSYIDTLPVFDYKAIIGVKNPLDCAVCLCEFEAEDKLRLLPKCSHAFHMECIDTWLLSHSTCPLCRASLLPDFSGSNRCSPIVLVLESGSDSSREIVTEREGVLGRSSSTARANSHFGVQCNEEFGLSRINLSHNSCEIQAKDDENQQKVVASKEKVVTVKLGKLRNVDGEGEGEGEGSSNNNADARRCFSMGSFEYVVDENSSLKVPIKTPKKKQSIKKPPLPLTPGHQPAMSECDCDSRREFNGFEEFRTIDIHSSGDNASIININVGDELNANVSNTIERGKKESSSVSKIWLRGKKDKPNSSREDYSRRAVSFRFPPPLHHNAVAPDEMNLKPKKGESDLGYYDEENQSRNSLDSQTNSTSFGKWTPLWLIGRQNKVVHSSSTPSV